MNGYGNKTKSVKLDGKELKDNLLPADVSGEHKIDIEMANNDFGSDSMNMVENKFTLSTPQGKYTDSVFSWEPMEGAKKYRVYKNGKVAEETTDTKFAVSESGFTELKVSAIGPNGFESFTSEPVWAYEEKNAQQLQMEKFAAKSSEDYVNYSGNGFVEISTEKNREISIPVEVSEAGKYLVDFRYSNGSGPWNTDNKCAIRSLYTNGDYIGAMIFPQRGKDEWSDWGYSNSFTVELKKGENNLKLKFEDWNNNMNVEVNKAMLDYLRVIPMD